MKDVRPLVLSLFIPLDVVCPLFLLFDVVRPFFLLYPRLFPLYPRLFLLDPSKTTLSLVSHVDGVNDHWCTNGRRQDGVNDRTEPTEVLYMPRDRPSLHGWMSGSTTRTSAFTWIMSPLPVGAMVHLQHQTQTNSRAISGWAMRLEDLLMLPQWLGEWLLTE